MKPTRYSVVLALVTLLLLTGTAAAREPAESPIRAGRYSVSGGLGFDDQSFSGAIGFGYFVLDGLMPGVLYRYTRYTDDRYDANSSEHNLNLYARYYFSLPESTVFPFVVADMGYLRFMQWGDDVKTRMADLFSVMGGGGAAFYLSRHFFIEGLIGVRHYVSPPTWSRLHVDPTRFEWNLGFGAVF